MWSNDIGVKKLNHRYRSQFHLIDFLTINSAPPHACTTTSATVIGANLSSIAALNKRNILSVSWPRMVSLLLARLQSHAPFLLPPLQGILDGSTRGVAIDSLAGQAPADKFAVLGFCY
jgi:hypothetical protein